MTKAVIVDQGGNLMPTLPPKIRKQLRKCVEDYQGDLDVANEIMNSAVLTGIITFSDETLYLFDNGGVMGSGNIHIMCAKNMKGQDVYSYLSSIINLSNSVKL